MANAPVQLVVNSNKLREDRRRTSPVDNGTDFFADNNPQFVTHRDSLLEAVRAIRVALAAGPHQGLGHVKVIMRRDAIAKSHRPQTKLFRARWTPQAGTDGVGEPIFAVTPTSLDKVIAAIEAAEIVVVDKTVAKTGEVKPNPSRNRCEVSAIESIALWSEADRREFSAVEAVAWLERAGTGSGYIINCFPTTTSPDFSDLAAGAAEAAAALRGTITVGQREARVLAEDRRAGTTLALTVSVIEPGYEPHADTALARSAITHEAILHELGTNPLVRTISLPPIVSGERGTSAALNDPAPEVYFAYPAEAPLAKVGVVDGGVGAHLDAWVAERWGVIADADRNTDHGTFISGLLIAEKRLNPDFPGEQQHGCVIFDIDVLPADPGDTGMAFDGYYPGGIAQFFDEIETAVGTYRRDHGVRVFNFSVNVRTPRTSHTYGWAAERLDQIAHTHDVIFVISAGNLDLTNTRPEWHHNPETALAALTADTAGFLSEPGESLQNVSVSAVNPPRIPGVPLALARYSRRGPGLRGATKPDFAHIGGSGTPLDDGSHGILSVNEAGSLVSGCGTSYAAPLVARRLADLDALIDGDVSKEVLIALMVHFANTPSLYSHKALLPAAQNLIGFGIPVTAESMLQRDDSEITLVVSTVLRPGEDNSFEFRWPDALVDDGKCSGKARLTLVARPPIAYEHGDERVRANIDVHLGQREEDGQFSTRIKRVNSVPTTDKAHKNERDLLVESMKWQLVKSFETTTMRGRGTSAEWQFRVDYLERADEPLPMDGVEYAAVLTISDPKHAAPVFAQMRQHLNAMGLRTDDIRTSIRARATT